MSSLAPSSIDAEQSCKDSPVNGCKVGSLQTFEQTSFNNDTHSPHPFCAVPADWFRVIIIDLDVTIDPDLLVLYRHTSNHYIPPVMKKFLKCKNIETRQK